MKPILFSTPMVQAILAGRKTMTRRICKPIPVYDHESGYVFIGNVMFDIHDGWDIPMYLKDIAKFKPGDTLWVRETWLHCPDGYVYKADHDGDKILTKDGGTTFVSSVKWKPSIFMPKEAARIFLKVTNVRVERLQDISEEDAISEGINSWFSDLFQETRYEDYETPISDWREPISSFRSLWRKINGKDSWDSNPWVWVYEFEKFDKP